MARKTLTITIELESLAELETITNALEMLRDVLEQPGREDPEIAATRMAATRLLERLS